MRVAASFTIALRVDLMIAYDLDMLCCLRLEILVKMDLGLRIGSICGVHYRPLHFNEPRDQ